MGVLSVKVRLAIIGVVLLVVGAATAVFITSGNTYSTAESDVNFEDGQVYNELSNDDRANVRAVTGLNFYKSKSSQEVSFCNDTANSYSEKITIYLSNGYVIYSSDYLAPGDCINEISIDELGEPGIYNGVIVYSFYTNDSNHNFVSRLETPIEISYIE